MKELDTDIRNGLSSREIHLKKRLFGDNQLQQATRVSPLGIFFSQFNDFITIVLIVATTISAMLGEVIDAIAIFAIVVMNGILGFIQEYRTEKSIEALKQMAAPTAKVIRDKEISLIPAKDVVPGDVVLLESGDRVPADGVLKEIESLFIDESMLTGESVPVEKHLKPDKKEQMKIHKKNLAFMGTLVVSGRGKMVVTGIGMDTEMGKIAGMMNKIEKEQTPLQNRLERLGKQLVVLCILICGVVAFLGVLRGEKAYDMFLFGVSLAVAAIPEGLPAIVTIVLTIGVQRMVKKHVIIRKLPAVETLGCATVICSDKTGTLTENRMSVRKIHVNNRNITVTGIGYRPEGDLISDDGEILTQTSPELKRLLEIGVSCNNANLYQAKTGILKALSGKQELKVSGDPTENAVLMAAYKAKVYKDDIDIKYQRLKEFTFDSDRKRMSVIVKTARGEIFLFTKGAPDVVISLCNKIEQDGRIREFTKKDENQITQAIEDMGKQALRVLAFAYKKMPVTELNDKDPENNLIFVGLMGMLDPPRAEVKDAITKCFSSGIRPVMITGDHKATAWAVAKELNMLTEGAFMLTGKQLDEMSETEFLNCVDNVAVYARVTPRHKLKIVKALKKKGHVVAMTGDGVNDAPAVKEADIGVSMGITGTDVTKEASAMILTDDNFASIVAAIEEGRIVYDNIRKFIRYLLSCNVGEILTMVWASLLGLPIPLLPIQILLMNLVTDGLPAMALGIDPPERDVMQKKPRGKNESIFSGGLGIKIIYRGIFISIATLISFILGYMYMKDLQIARTCAFSTLVAAQLIFVFECRSEKHGTWEQNPFSNIYLTLSVIISGAMFAAVIYVPFLQLIFHTTPLDGKMLAMIIALAGLSAVI